MSSKLSIKSNGLPVVICGFLLLSTFTGCGATPVEVKKEVRSVKVVQANIASVTTDVEYSSKLKPFTEISISPKTPGKVSKVNFKVGDAVKAGDVLFTLDSKDVNAQLQQQQATLKLQQANYTKTTQSTLEQQTMAQDDSVKRAQIAYDNANDMYKKHLELFKEEAISKQTLIDTESRLKSAAIELESAKSNQKLLKEKSGPQSVEMAAAQVNQAQAGVQSAAVQLDNTVLRSPVDGVVSVCNVKEGEMASSAVTSFTVINTSSIIAEVGVPDSMIGKVSKGQKITAKVNALDNKTVNGIVDSVSPAADATSKSYTVKIKIDNQGNVLKSGMFVRVLLPAEKKENILVVPNETIKTENGISYVYTVANKKIKKVAIETGISNEKVTEVLGNMKKGDQVVLQGQTFLDDGDEVNIVK